MKLAKVILFLLILIILSYNSNLAFASETVTDKTSICNVTMAHDSLEAKFTPDYMPTINGGEDLVAKIFITNKTSYAYKNTRVLAKVYYLESTSTNIDNGGQLIDIVLLKESFDVNGGSTKDATLSWKSDSRMRAGTYRMDIYTVQNGIHVIGDFARSGTGRSSTFFNIKGSDLKSNISILTDKTLFGDTPYAVEKMLLLEKQDTINNIKVFIKSSSTIDTTANLSWRVYNYGQFDEANMLFSTTSLVDLSKNKETLLNLEIPTFPSNRYHAILDIEQNGLHTIEVMRWGRGEVSPSSIDTYGIVEDGEFLVNKEIPKDFALKPGKRYVAFACVVGGYAKAPTTITMRLRDQDGTVIFSREETKISGTEIASYEYPFIPTRFSKKMQFEVTARTADFESKAKWSSDCGDNKDEWCKNESVFAPLNYGYIISISIIFMMFLISNMIKNKKLSFRK